MQTTVIFKTDKKTKKAAQKTVKSSARAYEPTPYLKRVLTQGEKEFATGKYKAFDSIEKLRAELDT